MASKPNKVMLLGIDSPIVPRLYQWAKEGKLPHLQGLIERGVYAPNCLVPHPTITPPNWTTLATGAWPGTHGITDFDVHLPGDPLNVVHKGFTAEDVLAETLWEAVTRAGKRAVVVNWPASWPANGRDGYQIAGYGLAPTDWELGGPRGSSLGMIALDALITTDFYPYGTQVQLRKASGWAGVEHGPRALEADATLEWHRPTEEMAPMVWRLLVDSSDGSGYDTVMLATAKDKGSVFARLKVGEWSENLVQNFTTANGTRRAATRVKLVELSPDGQQLRLYVLGPCALTGWGHPQSIEDEITSVEGLPTGKVGWEAFGFDWVDIDTVIESYHWQDVWLADASLQLLRTKPWDVYAIHIHDTDWIYHWLTDKLDPITAVKPEEVAYWQEMELRFYQSVDWTIGRLLEAAGEDTVVVVTSDHGAKTETSHFDANEVLEEAGLLVYLPDDEASRGAASGERDALPTREEVLGRAARRFRRVDWTKTRAYAQRTVHVYVNLKGRDPQGIVEPGAEHAAVVRQVIDALYSYRDPHTGLRAVSLALSREDARLLGHHGERSGDV
ncbi:MAG: alkaline phosphatase family protein, partial [Chloroflexota bacterium]